MKFGKELRRIIEHIMPAWRESFIAYKALKQQLNRVVSIQQMPSSAMASLRPIAPAVMAEEIRFLLLFYREIFKLNAFFTEAEEEFVIRLQDLRDRAVLKPRRSSLLRIWRDLVRLHGEMILLENYSSLNCLGLVKIVKKHDKVSSTIALLRLPLVRQILRQPFFQTELLFALIADCERTLGEVEESLRSIRGIPEEEEEEELERGCEDERNGNIVRSTAAALHTIQHLRNGSSTYGPSSLRYE